MRTVNVDGINICYFDNQSPSDKVILFIHGNSHSSQSFRHQYSDSKLAEFRLIGIDLPGHGFSGKSEIYGLDVFVSAVRGLLATIEHSSVLIVGHSLGGHVAIEALEELNPEGILIFGTPPLCHPLDLSGFRPNQSMPLLFKSDLTDDEIGQLLGEYYSSYQVTETERQEFKMADRDFRPAMSQSLATNNFKDEVSLWNRYKGRKAIIHGRSDSLIDSTYIAAKVNTDELWNGSITYVDSAHNLHIESPERFNEILFSFASEGP